MKSSVLILAVLFATVSVVYADNKTCFVTGVSIDKNNKPVKGASIIAYTPPTGWEDLVVNYQSDENGHFSVEMPCKSDNTDLFITPPLDYQSNFIPLKPPFWVSNKGYKYIAPVKLPSIRKGEFNIGNVIVPEYYKTEIKLEDERENAFLPEQLNYDFWIRIKTVDGKLVKWGGLSSNDFKNSRSLNESSLLMTLPEGKWIIEISFNGDEKPYFYPDKIVDLSNITSSDLQKITLKMSKKKLIK